MAARISCGSAMRPKPYSPQAMSPSFGPTVITPRVFNVARLVRVASCSHLRTFIAGATSTGLSVASSAVEARRSEEHTSELQTLLRTSYAVFCLKQKTIDTHTTQDQY